MKPIKQIQLNHNGWMMNILSSRVATITTPKKEIKTVYFGFDSQEKAKNFAIWMLKYNKCSKAITRESERLNTPWEVKSWDVSPKLINYCVNQDKLADANATISS